MFITKVNKANGNLNTELQLNKLFRDLSEESLIIFSRLLKVVDDDGVFELSTASSQGKLFVESCRNHDFSVAVACVWF